MTSLFFRLCRDDVGYNQYRCIQDVYIDFLIHNMSCQTPQQTLLIEDESLWRPCGSDEKLTGKLNSAKNCPALALRNVPEALVQSYISTKMSFSPENYDCPLNCAHWIYEHEKNDMERH
jgi:hypothetical protein